MLIHFPYECLNRMINDDKMTFNSRRSDVNFTSTSWRFATTLFCPLPCTIITLIMKLCWYCIFSVLLDRSCQAASVKLQYFRFYRLLAATSILLCIAAQYKFTGSTGFEFQVIVHCTQVLCHSLLTVYYLCINWYKLQFEINCACIHASIWKCSL